MTRILLVTSSNSYRIGDFLEAAYGYGADVIVATDGRASLEHLSAGRTIQIDFNNIVGSIEQVAILAARRPIDAVVPVDERATYFAARLSEALGLSHNSAESVRIAGRKDLLRACLTQAQLPQPYYRLVARDSDPMVEAGKITYPCVIKPVSMSGSRGVIRANNENEFVLTFNRVVCLLDDDAKIKCPSEANYFLLVENFVPGIEFAVEGLVTDGMLVMLALFDKPDLLDGPFFPETLYITPSRCSEHDARRIQLACSKAIQAVGIVSGPVHIELRLNAAEVTIIECAARTIGGLCGRVLQFGEDLSLEDLVIAEAAGRSLLPVEREKSAAGVLMIQVPCEGILREVTGISDAMRIPGVESIDITIPIGERVVPLPEGNQYLGFVAARDANPEGVERTLRRVDQLLNISIS